MELLFYFVLRADEHGLCFPTLAKRMRPFQVKRQHTPPQIVRLAFTGTPDGSTGSMLNPHPDG